MIRPGSHDQRRAAFLEAAVQMFDNLEDWYDQHPEASFGEIEAEARRQRRQLMGQALAILINGRDTGFPWPGQATGSPALREMRATDEVRAL